MEPPIFFNLHLELFLSMATFDFQRVYRILEYYRISIDTLW